MDRISLDLFGDKREKEDKGEGVATPLKNNNGGNSLSNFFKAKENKNKNSTKIPKSFRADINYDGDYKEEETFNILQTNGISSKINKDLNS
jgi:hypothetical protein